MTESKLQIVEVQVPGFEKVVRGEDREAGFRGIVAVHDTRLGPALGGMRMWAYSGWEEAQRDVLRLAEGMTYKSAVAQCGLGGGKSVLLGDSRNKTEALFRFAGRLVDSLNGLYVTAEDVGTSVTDMDVVAQETRHVTGRAKEVGGSGDPSPHTALGTFLAVEASLRERDGAGATLDGRRVAVQGLGHVGYWLCKHLREAGASLVVSDIHDERVDRVVREFDAEAVAPSEILTVECDVLAPCALGAVLDDATIPALRAKIVCGAANNQLLDTDRDAKLLAERGIWFVPDFVANRMGIVNCANEQYGRLSEDPAILRHFDQHAEGSVFQVTKLVLLRARELGQTPSEAANLLADELGRVPHPIWGHRTKHIIDDLLQNGWAGTPRLADDAA